MYLGFYQVASQTLDTAMAGLLNRWLSEDDANKAISMLGRYQIGAEKQVDKTLYRVAAYPTSGHISNPDAVALTSTGQRPDTGTSLTAVNVDNTATGVTIAGTVGTPPH
ncbi:hypothetical protein PEC301879_03780 [Pectobacterium carotovorum subsp. carotovorum]|nr:hypothetical protein PEC301879_03780 [Pectobacterium carotovorum subsp. carotovorum]